MLDFLGTTENFAVVENRPLLMQWRFTDAWTDESVSLDGVTISGIVYLGETRNPLELDIAKGEANNLLSVGCIGLPEGRWPYEIFATADDGSKRRLLSGHIGVIGTHALSALREADIYVDRTLEIKLPGHISQPVRLEWMASTLAQSAAASAWDAFQKTEATAEQLVRAEQTLADLTGKADHAMAELGKVDGLMDELHAEVDRAGQAAQKAQDLLDSGILQGPKGDTPSIGPNGHWWIGGVDTGIAAEGRDGLTPHIGTNGHWWIGAVDTQVQAEGTNGLDADSIRRLYIASEEELPEQGDPRTHCYVPNPGGGYDTYIWLDYPDGEPAWTAVNETAVHQARVDAHGIIRLSTGSTLTEGGIVGVNEQGQLLVRPAMVSWPGVVALSASGSITGDSGLIGLNATGQAVVQEAAWNRAGVVKIENARNTERGAKVQTNAAGQAIVPIAGDRAYGVVATGTQYPVIPHERPYIVSLPIASDDARLNSAALYGTLTINLHRRGFLRYTSGANAENGLDYATGRYLSFDYGTGLAAEEYTSSIEGVTDVRCRLAVRRYADIVFHDSYADALRGGSVRIGPTMTIDSHGILNLRLATATVAGGIKTGSTLVMDAAGTLDIRLDASFNETSPRPAASTAVAAWLKAKNYVSEAALNGRSYVSENRLRDVLTSYQGKMGIRDILPLPQEQYENLPVKNADTLYLIY